MPCKANLAAPHASSHPLRGPHTREPVLLSKATAFKRPALGLLQNHESYGAAWNCFTLKVPFREYPTLEALRPYTLGVNVRRLHGSQLVTSDLSLRGGKTADS